MILRLDQVELRLVLVVVVGDVFVGDVDLRRDFLVQHLVDGQGAAQILLEVVEGNPAFLQPLVELLLGEGRLDLGQLGVDFLVGSQQSQLFGALHQDLVIDEVADDFQLERVRLFGAGLLRRTGNLDIVELLHFGARDVAPIHGRHHVVADLLVVTAKGSQK